MSIRTLLTCTGLLWALPLLLPSLVMAAQNPTALPSADASSEQSAITVETNAPDESGRTEKSGGTGKSVPTSRPAEDAGAVSQALTRLYRIPLPNSSPALRQPQLNANNSSRNDTRTDRTPPRQFGPSGRGEAPRNVISDDNRMGMQHADAIRNSVSEQANGDPSRQPPTGGHIVRNSPSGPAVAREDSLSAYNWGPHTDDAYAAPEAPLNERHGGQYIAPGRFGFVQSPQQAHWSTRALARTQSTLSTANSNMSRGLAAFRSGNYRTAAKYFKLASESNQGDPSAMIYSAHALFAIGRYQEGAAFLRKAFALEPRIALLTYDMRDDYRDRTDFDQQVRALNNAIASSPGNMDRLTLLGYVLNYSDQPDRAFDVLSRARAINPKDKLVKLLYESGQPPDVATDPRRR